MAVSFTRKYPGAFSQLETTSPDHESVPTWTPYPAPKHIMVYLKAAEFRLARRIAPFYDVGGALAIVRRGVLEVDDDRLAGVRSHHDVAWPEVVVLQPATMYLQEVSPDVQPMRR